MCRYVAVLECKHTYTCTCISVYVYICLYLLNWRRFHYQHDCVAAFLWCSLLAPSREFADEDVTNFCVHTPTTRP